MVHAIGYLGPYDPNIMRLTSGATTYVNYDGTTGENDVPSGRVDGIFFGYLQQRERQFFVVRASFGELMVNLTEKDRPVLIEPARHTDGKGFGPRPSTFGDDSAANLLDDMITANPGHAVALQAIGKQAGVL